MGKDFSRWSKGLKGLEGATSMRNRDFFSISTAILLLMGPPHPPPPKKKKPAWARICLFVDETSFCLVKFPNTFDEWAAQLFSWGVGNNTHDNDNDDSDNNIDNDDNNIDDNTNDPGPPNWLPKKIRSVAIEIEGWRRGLGQYGQRHPIGMPFGTESPRLRLLLSALCSGLWDIVVRICFVILSNLKYMYIYTHLSYTCTDIHMCIEYGNMS